jgi:DNA modification methylase
MPLTDLAPAPYNPRQISAKAMKGLRASIKRFGLVQPIVFNRRSGHVVGGHQRIDALKTLGETAAQVVVVDLPESEEKALNVSLNNPGIAGEFTKSIGDIIGEIRLSLPSLDFDELRFDELADPPAVIEDEVPEPPKVPVTKVGNLWTLGRHRVLCGDATKAEDVAAALGKAKPFLMVTDPPYGVDYSPEWREEAAKKGQIRGGAKAMGKVANDDRCDWSPAWLLSPVSVAYVWHAGRHASEVQRSIEAARFEIRCQIIWAKPFAPISRGAYRWQHEPCWYAVRKGSAAAWVGDHNQATIWAIANRTFQGGRGEAHDAITGHGTQKPVECMAHPMRNHEAPETYDPFLGSGTTLIAAEQLDRTCYGLEIEPRYCDVIVERWQNLTGQKAKRAA